jgi:hypothetical protein
MNDARRRRLKLQERIKSQKPKAMTHERLAELMEQHFNPKARVFVFLDNSEVMIADAPVADITRTVQRSANQGLWFTDGYCMTFVPPHEIRRIGIFKKD